jgi:uncharacterized membrane protein
VLGLTFTFLVPPLQKPDEHGHFIRSILLSHGKIFLTNEDALLPIEKQYYDLIHDRLLNAIPYHSQVKFNTTWYGRSLFAAKDAYRLMNEVTWGQFMLPAASYIPYAAGMYVARLFYLNAHLTFFAGRLAMFLVIFFWMIFLYKRIPSPYRPILLFVCSLPMVIHQITGYNYDAMQYLMGFSLFVLLLNLLEKRKLNWADLGVLSGIYILYLILKLSFEPMLLLIFVIPYKKIDTGFAGYVKKILFVIAVIMIGYFLIKSTFFISATQYTHHPKGINPALQIQYILSHPFGYLQILARSGIHLTKFHVQGLIGIFGWLDYSMDPWLYILFIGAGVYLVATTKIKHKEHFSQWQIFIIMGSLLLTYFFMLTIFYLNWKPVGSTMIDGTQGRYFISMLPFFLFGLIQLRGNTLLNVKMPKINFLLVFILFFVIVSIVNSIRTRYY